MENAVRYSRLNPSFGKTAKTWRGGPRLPRFISLLFSTFEGGSSKLFQN